MRAAISSLLSEHCTLIGAADRGDVVLALVADLRPDVVVLDISLPGQSGLQLLPELRRQHPSMGIVMLTSRDEPLFREECARRGADGYVLKDRAAEELWPALRHAAHVRHEGSVPSAKLA